MVHIIIIEDSIEDRFFLCRALRKIEEDSFIVEFSYVEDALSYLRSPDRPHFDLILVDINTPRMTGFEFADAYFDLYPELKLRTEVHLMSTSINPSDSSYAKEHPAVSGFLKKPVHETDLRMVLGALSQ